MDPTLQGQAWKTGRVSPHWKLPPPSRRSPRSNRHLCLVAQWRQALLGSFLVAAPLGPTSPAWSPRRSPRWAVLSRAVLGVSPRSATARHPELPIRKMLPLVNPRAGTRDVSPESSRTLGGGCCLCSLASNDRIEPQTSGSRWKLVSRPLAVPRGPVWPQHTKGRG